MREHRSLTSDLGLGLGLEPASLSPELLLLGIPDSTRWDELRLTRFPDLASLCRLRGREEFAASREAAEKGGAVLGSLALLARRIL